ncbi:hypothetical protein [Sporomusa malonica]|uniref:Uncharacterized protein n=1 Tax=Sporomusa malonica TaxID=112901 RepID=A0A1W2CSS8_9FIRM|nr:hypothetical protein [Sporomusa malonica]SMC88273.1 hypothetical protein SAMN04488500_111125 [Sporomusa malonica]
MSHIIAVASKNRPWQCSGNAGNEIITVKLGYVSIVKLYKSIWFNLLPKL